MTKVRPGAQTGWAGLLLLVPDLERNIDAGCPDRSNGIFISKPACIGHYPYFFRARNGDSNAALLEVEVAPNAVYAIPLLIADKTWALFSGLSLM